jgi:hypothetical protein
VEEAAVSRWLIKQVSLSCLNGKSLSLSRIASGNRSLANLFRESSQRRSPLLLWTLCGLCFYGYLPYSRMASAKLNSNAADSPDRIVSGGLV